MKNMQTANSKRQIVNRKEKREFFFPCNLDDSPQFTVYSSQFTRSAFTLAEMMVVLLILSLVMAAFLPVITKKSKTPTGIWQYAANNADAYFGLGATQGIAIGANGLSSTGARIFINTNNADQPAMSFQQAGANAGKLILTTTAGSTYGAWNVGLGNVTLPPPSLGTAATVIGYNARALGGGAITAIGYNAYGNGTGGTTAIGTNATAGTTTDGWSATAVGYTATATGGGSTAVGGNNGTVGPTASGSSSSAFGAGAQATGGSSSAIGFNAQAIQTYSTALGYNAQALGPHSTVIGSGAKATDTANAESTVMGYGASAAGPWETIYGTNASGTGNVAVAIGYNAQAGNNGVAVGRNTVATSFATTVLGTNAVTNGNYATAIGWQAQAIQQNTVAVGASSYAAENATAVGYQANAPGWSSIAIGYQANALSSTIAIGYGTNASVTSGWGGAQAIGYGAVANAVASTATGPSTLASGDNSIAMGYKAQATSDYSIAMGYNAITYGTGSTAIGQGAYTGTSSVTSIDSIAIGKGANSTNGNATAVGVGASASANNAIAIGIFTSASGPGSIAIGRDSNGTSASTDVQDQIKLGTALHTVLILGKLNIGTPAGSAAGAALSLNGTGVYWTSDKRLKNITSDFVDGLEKIRQLQTYNFTFKADKEKTPHVGVMAQDLQKVFPDAVTKDDKGYLMIRQDDMFYAMINSIKQLDKIVQGIIDDVKSLVARVQKIEDKIEGVIKAVQTNSKEIQALKTKNSQLEARIKKLEKHS